MTVNTVLGPVPPESLGITLTAEHFYFQTHGGQGRFSTMLLDDDVLVEEIAAFKAAGGGCIVDDTPPCAGRYPERLAELSRRSGVHIVMGSGWYTGDFVPPEDGLERKSVQAIAEDLIREITDGVGDTQIKPGVVGEFGPDRNYISPLEERFHRAIARASRATGIALVTHAYHGTVGLDQLDLFEEEGVDPGNVAIGHVQRHPIMDYWLEIISRGAYALVDNIGLSMPGLEDRLVRMIADLVDRGHVERILLAHDTGRSEELSYFGGHGYAYIPRTFRTRLMDAGLSEAELSTILVDNPARLLSMPD